MSNQNQNPGQQNQNPGQKPGQQQGGGQKPGQQQQDPSRQGQNPNPRETASSSPELSDRKAPPQGGAFRLRGAGGSPRTKNVENEPMQRALSAWLPGSSPGCRPPIPPLR